MSSSPSKLMTCCLKVWGTIVGPGLGVQGWLKKMSGSGPPLGQSPSRTVVSDEQSADYFELITPGTGHRRVCKQG